MYSMEIKKMFKKAKRACLNDDFKELEDRFFDLIDKFTLPKSSKPSLIQNVTNKGIAKKLVKVGVYGKIPKKIVIFKKKSFEG